MNCRDPDDELAAISLHQSTFDLADRRSHRPTKRDTTGVVDIQPYYPPDLGNRPPGRLQRIAAHQSDGTNKACKPSKDGHR
jgi:hypothetical protein